MIGKVCPEKVFATQSDFTQHFELGKQKRLILAVDQAAFYTSEKVRVSEGVHLLFTPPKSPELQPAERLWSLTNEARLLTAVSPTWMNWKLPLPTAVEPC